MTSDTLSQVVARHLTSVAFAALPPEALEAARRALLDALGVMLAATGLSPEVAPYRKVASIGGPGPCRVLGSAAGAAPIAAAFANASLAHALDFGDTFDAGPAHPHAALVPALMAIADFRPELSFGEFLAALATGSDLACRLSLAPSRAYEEGGWYPPPLVNLISAAAACAKALALTPAGVCDAMGFALLGATFPAILKNDRQSPLRGLREAFAARGAVEAALLAAAGAQAFTDPLGAEGGFFDVYGGGNHNAALLSGLGEQFVGAKVSFKPWPACRGTHAYIEAALHLRPNVNVGDIASIEVDVGPIQQMLVRPLGESPPATQAKFSIPFTVAVALLEGEVDLDSFDEHHRRDPRIARLARVVQACSVPAWGREHAASGRLRLILHDGQVLEREVLTALGSPERPLSNEMLVSKF
ncbi:MAG: MmgE/PrpD family protein, partial [Croceibacterium sp.]